MPDDLYVTFFIRGSAVLSNQLLTNVFSFAHAAGTSEHSACGMRRELVQGIKFCHFIEDFDEAGARVALIADE